MISSPAQKLKLELLKKYTPIEHSAFQPAFEALANGNKEGAKAIMATFSPDQRPRFVAYNSDYNQLKRLDIEELSQKIAESEKRSAVLTTQYQLAQTKLVDATKKVEESKTKEKTASAAVAKTIEKISGTAAASTVARTLPTATAIKPKAAPKK